jgi:hypothetical protein
MDGTVQINISVRKYSLKELGRDIIYSLVVIAFFTNELSKRFFGLSVPRLYHRVVDPVKRVIDTVGDFVKKILIAIIVIMIGILALAFSVVTIASALGYL